MGADPCGVAWFEPPHLNGQVVQTQSPPPPPLFLGEDEKNSRLPRGPVKFELDCRGDREGRRPGQFRGFRSKSNMTRLRSSHPLCVWKYDILRQCEAVHALRDQFASPHPPQKTTIEKQLFPMPDIFVTGESPAAKVGRDGRR